MKGTSQIGKALGRVPSGLFVVTTKHEDSEDAVIASWVSQCSFTPPALSIVLATVRPARLLIEASSAFTVNILGVDSKDLMKHFFQASKDDLFKGIKTKKGFQGTRILSDAVAYLECAVTESAHSGDHVMYIGEIVGGKMLKGGEPYIHVRSDGFSY